MGNLTIRRAEPNDAALLSELGERTFVETFASANTPEDMAAYLAHSFNLSKQQEELSDPQSLFLIAESEGVAIGYAKLQAGKTPDCINKETPVEVVRLYVEHQWLGRGAGHALMEACLTEARARGYQTVWLGVWEHNVRAQAFYRKWNFQEVGTQVFQLGADMQTDLVMELVFDSHEEHTLNRSFDCLAGERA
jgi:diamine N-acetyltransferase